MEAIKSQLDNVLAKLESNEALISDVKAMKRLAKNLEKIFLPTLKNLTKRLTPYKLNWTV